MAVNGKWKRHPSYRKASDFGKRLWPEDIPDKESISYSRHGARNPFHGKSFWDKFDNLPRKEKEWYWE